MQLVDRTLDDQIAAARPVVSADFADAVMRRVTFAPARDVRRRTSRLVAGVLIAAAAVVVAIVVARNGESPKHDSVAHRDVLPLPTVAPKTPTAAELEERVRQIESKVPHGADPKLQRCQHCHLVSAKPAANAVAIVAFLDLEASDASAAVRELDTLAIQFGDRVRIEVKLVARLHPTAAFVTFAALSAGLQGKLWPMLERIVDDHDRSVLALKRHAEELRLDLTKFGGGLSDRTVLDAVLAAVADADRLQINNGFVVESRVFTGATAIDEMRRFAIRSALERNWGPRVKASIEVE